MDAKIKGKLYNIKNRADQIELVKMLPKSIRNDRRNDLTYTKDISWVKQYKNHMEHKT